MIRSFLLAALVAMVPMPVLAQASPSQVSEAQHLYELGVIAYERQEWARCADYFERSFTLVFAPELLFNVGRCYAADGEATGEIDTLQRAVLAYLRYLRDHTGIEAAERSTVEAEVARIRARIESIRASVLPLTQPDPEPEPVVVEEPAPVETTVPSEAFEVEAPVPDEGFGYSLTVTGAALTGATLIAAIVVGVVAEQRFAALASTCGATPGGCTDGQIREVDALGTAANVMFGMSGVLAAGTGVLFGFEVSGTF